jgi:hypothetical protein
MSPDFGMSLPNITKHTNLMPMENILFISKEIMSEYSAMGWKITTYRTYFQRKSMTEPKRYAVDSTVNDDTPEIESREP